MAESITIRPLRKSDDRSKFTSGEPQIDRYFRFYAGQNHFRLKLAISYVALREAQILGFATLSVATIEKQSLPDPPLKQKLPRYPIPVLRLARLGVDHRFQGHGIAKALLRFVFKLALEQSERLGCLGVLVDAKGQAQAFYEKLGFVELRGLRQGRVHGAPVSMFLSLKQISAAQSL